MKKLLVTYYLLALFFGLYNFIIWFIPRIPLREAIQIGFSLSDLIVIPMFLILFILSILVIVYYSKNNISRIHLVYPIYYTSLFLLLILIGINVYRAYGLNRGIDIMDRIGNYSIILYIFDVLFPAYLIKSQFLDNLKSILKKFFS